jgi:hypothetical protein
MVGDGGLVTEPFQAGRPATVVADSVPSRWWIALVVLVPVITLTAWPLIATHTSHPGQRPDRSAQTGLAVGAGTGVSPATVMPSANRARPVVAVDMVKSLPSYPSRVAHHRLGSTVLLFRCPRIACSGSWLRSIFAAPVSVVDLALVLIAGEPWRRVLGSLAPAMVTWRTSGARPRQRVNVAVSWPPAPARSLLGLG